MAGVSKIPLPLEEGVEIIYLDPRERDIQVAALDEPWIADEGPLEARFRLSDKGSLLHRGLAFDQKTTVAWDEDAVQVVRPAKPDSEVVAQAHPVLVRERLDGPRELVRIDYQRHGVWLGSRYVASSLEEIRRKNHA